MFFLPQCQKLSKSGCDNLRPTPEKHLTKMVRVIVGKPEEPGGKRERRFRVTGL